MKKVVLHSTWMTICLWLFSIIGGLSLFVIILNLLGIISLQICLALLALLFLVILIPFISFGIFANRMWLRIIFQKKGYFTIAHASRQVHFEPNDIQGIEIRDAGEIGMKKGIHRYDDVQTFGIGKFDKVLIIHIVPFTDPLAPARPKPKFLQAPTNAQFPGKYIIGFKDIEKVTRFLLSIRPELVVGQHVENQPIYMKPEKVLKQQKKSVFIIPIVLIVLDVITIMTSAFFLRRAALPVVFIATAITILIIVIYLCVQTRVTLRIYPNKAVFQFGRLRQMNLDVDTILAVKSVTIEPQRKTTIHNFVYSIGMSGTNRALQVQLETFTEERKQEVLAQKQKPVEVIQIRCLQPEIFEQAIQNMLDNNK